MSLSPQDRETLERLYLEKADATLDDADWLVAENRYSIAAGRYYYACFYAIQALFVHDGVATKSHRGTQRVFLHQYVYLGKFDKMLGAWLSRMERLRELADYNCAYTISKEEVCAMSKPASDIISSIKNLLSEQR